MLEESKIVTPVFFTFFLSTQLFLLTGVSLPLFQQLLYCDILPPAKWEVEQLLAEPKPIFCLGSVGKDFCERSKDAVNDMY